MFDEAIALCRVSSREQLLSHSLDLQGESVQTMADELNVAIVKKWAINQSSKKGQNIKRKDLQEALVFCRKNKRVKYLLVDKVHRYMREMEMLFYFKVLFGQEGVKLLFCAPDQRALNEDTPEAKLKLAQKAYDAEVSNAERKDIALTRMSARVSAGYYPFNTHAGYKKTSAEDGLHVPDEPRFSLLRKGCHLIIYKQHTAPQAVKWMNANGYKTRGGNKLDINHFEVFISDEYYCGIININKKGWPKNVPGLHVPLLSKREHALLMAIIKKRNPRIRSKHNHEFPLANILRHDECKGLGGYEKFAGHYHNRGKRPSGSQRPKKPVYDCRDCRRRIPREKMHEAFSEHLSGLEFLPTAKAFKNALLRVWKNQRGSNVQKTRVLNSSKEALEKKIKITTEAYATEDEETIKDSLRKLLTEYNQELKNIETDLYETSNVDLESENFVRFAFDHVEKMKDRWWKLSWENMKRGEQILFNGKIFADNSANVHTPSLSSIYRLGTNKKALSGMDNAHLVELQGIAPWSASLPMLAVYRFSLFAYLKLHVKTDKSM